MNELQLFDYIRTQRQDYESRSIQLTDGIEFSQYSIIRKVNHYWSNQYLDNAEDDIIGPYPFDNVSKFRVLLEARATDFDTKHVELEPKNLDRVSKVEAMIATKAVRNYLEEIKFGKFINDLCITRAKYGGVLVKKTDTGFHVIPWENIVTDQSDIMAGVRIERHYMTPSEMLKMGNVWDNVKDALKTAREWRDKGTENGVETATQGNIIEVYEIQGDVPVSMLKHAQAIKDGKEYDPYAEGNEDDDYTYVPVKIIACGADWNEKRQNDAGEDYDHEDGVVLYAKKQETTHKYLARNPIVGRGLGEGVVESLFQHQKWHNFTKTEEMRMIAIAGKKLYWTDDPEVLANIFDNGVDHGTVLQVSQGKTLSELNQLPTGMPVYQTTRQEWDESATRETSSHAAKLGEEGKAGVPFRAQYLQNIEASSQFEQYREEIGFLIKECVEDAKPDALKKLDTEDEIMAAFTPQELQMIDDAIITDKVNEKVIKASLDERVVSPEEKQMLIEEITASLRKQGSKRHLKEVKEFIKNSGGSVRVHTTDEARNKAVYFETLSNALLMFQPGEPGYLAVRDRVMDAIGIPREELELYADQTVQPQQGGQAPQLQADQLNRSQMVGADLARTG